MNNKKYIDEIILDDYKKCLKSLENIAINIKKSINSLSKNNINEISSEINKILNFAISLPNYQNDENSYYLDNTPANHIPIDILIEELREIKNIYEKLTKMDNKNTHLFLLEYSSLNDDIIMICKYLCNIMPNHAE